jgi:hypothetical protein
MAIQYQYAQVDGDVFDISDITEFDRRKNFSCLGCGNHMVPVIGKQVESHFRHKVELSCSGETYLHRLAKHKFCEAYTECLELRKPFFIEVPYTKECRFYLEKLGLSCKDTSTKQFDLTQYFSEPPLIESRWGDFVPDILLRTPKGVPLFVEIKVSHACSQEKINSKCRIIEIEVDSVDSIDFDSGLGKKTIFEIFNFNGLVEKVDCRGKCLEKSKILEENSLLSQKLEEITVWARRIHGRDLSGEISLQDIEDYEKYIEEVRQRRERRINEEKAREIERLNKLKLGRSALFSGKADSPRKLILSDPRSRQLEKMSTFKIDGREVLAYNYFDALERLEYLPEIYPSDYLEDPELDSP